MTQRPDGRPPLDEPFAGMPFDLTQQGPMREQLRSLARAVLTMLDPPTCADFPPSVKRARAWNRRGRPCPSAVVAQALRGQPIRALPAVAWPETSGNPGPAWAMSTDANNR